MPHRLLLTIGCILFLQACQTGDTKGSSTRGATPATEARALKATGFEPGWSLEIGQNALTLVTDYGQRRLRTEIPEAEQEGDLTRYRLPKRNITIEIQEKPCRDAGKGDMHALTVTVHMESQTLQGCGNPKQPDAAATNGDR